MCGIELAARRLGKRHNEGRKGLKALLVSVFAVDHSEASGTSATLYWPCMLCTPLYSTAQVEKHVISRL